MSNISDIHVLVVDDDDAVLDILTTFLDEYGFSVASCGSTEEARDLLRETSFDVCIVDLDLPGFSGEDLIMLAHQRYPHQRYIIHSGADSYYIPEKLEAIGIRPEHIFQKPLRVPSLMVKCIKELVEERSGEIGPENPGSV